jgi:hypothetical protein
VPESFGARLRQQRERQTIAIAAIAQQTKIKQSLLEALEHDDVSRWPGGIFRRAYIRAYAHAIGLDADVVVREFLQLYPDPADIAAVPSGEREAAVQRPDSRPPTRIESFVGSTLATLSRRWVGTPQKSSEPIDSPPVADRGERIIERPPEDLVDGPLEATPGTAHRPADPDLAQAADLCTAFACVATIDDMVPLLGRASEILGAIGLIVWVWDPHASRLRPTLAHGYSDRILAQIPEIGPDAANATAAAFRAAQLCAVESPGQSSDALVVPLMNASGCGGVLAIELPHSRVQSSAVRAVATIFAAQLARLTDVDREIEAAGASFTRLECKRGTC